MIEGVEKDVVFLGILGVHEIAFCCTVKEGWSVNDFVVCWGFASMGSVMMKAIPLCDSNTVDKMSSKSDIETDHSIKNPSCPSPLFPLPCFPPWVPVPLLLLLHLMWQVSF